MPLDKWMFYKKRYIDIYLCDMKRHLQKIFPFTISIIFHFDFYKFGAVIPLRQVKLLPRKPEGR